MQINLPVYLCSEQVLPSSLPIFLLLSTLAVVLTTLGQGHCVFVGFCGFLPALVLTLSELYHCWTS